MIAKKGHKWVTLDDDMYIGINNKPRKVIAVYAGNKKVYPIDIKYTVYWLAYDIYGRNLPFTVNWPKHPSEYSIEGLYDYAKKHPCIKSKTKEQDTDLYTIVFEQDGAVLTFQHVPKDCIGAFYIYSGAEGGWPDFFLYSKINNAPNAIVTASGNIRGQWIDGRGSFIYSE